LADVAPIPASITNEPVTVNLKISKEHTADGSGRQVEFVFNPQSDNFEVSGDLSSLY
jgi:hypothetical protein